MRYLDIEPGRKVGETLNYFLEQVMNEEVENETATLFRLVDKYKEEKQ